MFSKNKSAKKLLKWPKFRYYSDRLLQILLNVSSYQADIFLNEGIILENSKGVQSYSFCLFNHDIK